MTESAPRPLPCEGRSDYNRAVGNVVRDSQTRDVGIVTEASSTHILVIFGGETIRYDNGSEGRRMYRAECLARSLAEYVEQVGAPVPPTPWTEDVEKYRARVRQVAAKYKKIHGLCGVIDQAVAECDQPPPVERTYLVTATWEVTGTAENAAAVARMDDPERARVEWRGHGADIGPDEDSEIRARVSPRLNGGWVTENVREVEVVVRPAPVPDAAETGQTGGTGDQDGQPAPE